MSERSELAHGRAGDRGARPAAPRAGKRGLSALWRTLAGRRRVRTPTMLQNQRAECGAACLGIVLGAFGRHERLEKLRYACGVSRDGAKASNLLRAGRSFGLLGKGFAANSYEARQVPLPFVAFWNFTHFVVVEGFGRGKVFLNDPATGPRTLSEQQFRESYSGVLLAFQPAGDFEPNEAPPGAIRSLLLHSKDAKGALGFVVLASLTLFVPGLLMPAFSQIFVDFFLIAEQSRWLLPLLALMVATALFTTALSWLFDNGLIRYYTKLQTLWSTQLVWRVLRLPIDYFTQRSGGDISNRIQTTGWLAWLVAGELSSTLFGLTTLAVYALVMLQYDVVLTLIGVGFAAVNLVAFIGVSRELEDRNQQLYQEKGKLDGLLMQGLRSIDTYQASGTESVFYNRWTGRQAKVANAGQAIGRTRAVLTALPPFVGLLSTTAILLLGGLHIMDGKLTIGMLVAFQGLMAALSLPVQQVIDSSAVLQEAQGLLNRLDDVMRQDPDREFLRGDVPAPTGTAAPSLPRKLGGTLEVGRLSFGFSPLDPPWIQGFDLRLEVGSRVALVGASGSGKSTLGRLIAGILEPWSGDITIDGFPIATIPRDILRNTVAVIDQGIALFEGTVAENITMWDPTLPEERMIEAARDACLHDEIAARPGGYRERIEEGGRNFSGGERQRIEIARALVLRPSLLILDEATSALDARTESRILDNLRRRGCTSIVIAHRLSTIRDCDQIIVLSNGTVVERGTHDELMATGGPYRSLVESG